MAPGIVRQSRWFPLHLSTAVPQCALLSVMDSAPEEGGGVNSAHSTSPTRLLLQSFVFSRVWTHCTGNISSHGWEISGEKGKERRAERRKGFPLSGEGKVEDPASCEKLHLPGWQLIGNGQLSPKTRVFLASADSHAPRTVCKKQPLISKNPPALITTEWELVALAWFLGTAWSWAPCSDTRVRMGGWNRDGLPCHPRGMCTENQI